MTPLPSGLSTRPGSFAPSGESYLRLQQAIESLNLNLDDELYRYRQSQSSPTVVPPTPARPQLRQQRKSLDLIALKSATAAAAAPGATAPPPNARLQELLGQSSEPTVQAYPPKTAINQVRLSHGGTLTTYRAAPEDYLDSTEALLGSLPDGAQGPEDTEYSPSFLRQLTTPLGIGAMLLLLVSSAGFGYLVTSPEAVQHLANNPITRRFQADPTPTEEDTLDGPVAADGTVSQEDSGFEPPGPDLSEQEFKSLDLNRISTLPSSSSNSVTQDTSVTGQPLGETRPGNLGTPSRPGEPGSTSTPVGSEVLRAAVVTAPGTAARPRPTTPQTTVAPSRVNTAPVAAPPAQRVAPPAPIARPPQPLAANPAPAAPPAPLSRPAVAPPAPITQAAPAAAAPSYYVVTDYTGAQSLESARGAVGDAYVRNFSNGTRIQMGVFSQESSARNLVNQLQGQGIPAQVITP